MFLKLISVLIHVFSRLIYSHSINSLSIFSYECQGLIAVGPIIELNFDDINLLQPIQFTFPILVQPKKKKSPPPPPPKPITIDDPNAPPPPTTSQPSQQELINQQQQSIFKSMLGEGKKTQKIHSEK